MFEKVLYATDFSDEAVEALEYVRQLQNAGMKEVVILHVIDRRGLSDLSWYATKDVEGIQRELEKKAAAEIHHIEEDLKKRGIAVKVLIRRGGPYNEIMTVAEEEDVSIIVTGAHGTGNFEELFLGSVSYRVVRRVKRPILVVKK